MDSAQQTLISLEPPQTLLFHLEKGTEPRSVLKVTNITSCKVVFKVKTTQPSWYYVRPNQQILEPGQSEEVKVLLVGTECNRFLAAAEGGKEEKLDKHRFLVQSKVVSEDEYAAIMLLPVAKRNDEFSKLWEGSKDGLKNVKLKVEYTYDFTSTAATAASGTATAAADDDDTRGGLNRSGNNSNSALQNSSNNNNNSSSNSSTMAANGGGNNTGSGNSNSSNSSSGFPSNLTPEALFVELQSLRKKYDAVVEYTVHLTAERDSIVAQLDLVQHELTKEKSRKKADINSSNNNSSNNSSSGGDTSNGSSSSKAAKKNDKLGSDKKIVEKGFSLFVVLFTALLCFLLGKYWKLE